MGSNKMLEILEVLNGENLLENIIESLRLFAQYDLHRWFLETSIMFEVTLIAFIVKYLLNSKATESHFTDVYRR